MQESHFVGSVTDNVTVITYEQDLKVAFWELAKGSRYLQDELGEMICGDPTRPLTEQLDLIVRIFRGQEHKLMRDTLLRILRKTIEDLPDVKTALQNSEREYARNKKLEAEEERLS